MEDTGDLRQRFDDLVSELEEIRRRGVRRLDGDERLRPKATLPLIDRLADELTASVSAADWPRWRRIETLLETAKSRLRPGSAIDGEGRRLRLQGLETTEVASRVELLFGLRDGMRDLWPDQLMGQVKEYYRDKLEDDKTLQRRNESARQHLADAICLVFVQPLPLPVPVQPQLVYISRPELERQLKAHVESGARLIVFHGLPGMGKTWLAQAAAAGLHGGPVPEITIGPDGIDTTSLVSALRRCQIEVEGPLDGHEGEHLAALLSDQNAPPFLLIDNLDSVDDLAELLPPLGNIPKTVVVATCRVKSEAIPTCWFIAVGKMSEGEAESLIRAGLPHLSRADAAYLASALEAHPLAIRFACRILQLRVVSVGEFCRETKAKADELAELLRTNEGATIGALLVWLVGLVFERDLLAFKLLRFICLVQESVIIGDQFLRHYAEWTDGPQSYMDHLNGEGEVSPLRYGEAVGVMVDSGLVDQITEYAGDGQPVACFIMHNLTGAVLRSLFNETGNAELVAQDLLFWTVHLLERRKHPGEFPADLASIFLGGFELLGKLLIDGVDDPAFELIIRRHDPWLANAMAVLLLTSLEHAPLDEQQEEFRHSIPAHWYRWAVGFIQEHKEWYPGTEAPSYDQLMEIAKRFGIEAADA